MIDAHQHFWRYRPPVPTWMGDGMDGMRRDFLIDDLVAVAAEVGVTGAILVECETSMFPAEDDNRKTGRARLAVDSLATVQRW